MSGVALNSNGLTVGENQKKKITGRTPRKNGRDQV